MTDTIKTWQYRVKVEGCWEGDAMKLEIDDLRAALAQQTEQVTTLAEVQDRIIDRLQQAEQVPPGYQLVPVEPTKAIYKAVHTVFDNARKQGQGLPLVSEIHKAMLAAKEST